MPRMPKQKRGESRQDYCTPPEFLTALKQKLGIGRFAADLAASQGNAVATLCYTEEDNALDDANTWNFNDWAFLNPPFANITPWAMKAVIESAKGAQIVMLVPASVGSNWWRDY